MDSDNREFFETGIVSIIPVMSSCYVYQYFSLYSFSLLSNVFGVNALQFIHPWKAGYVVFSMGSCE